MFTPSLTMMYAETRQQEYRRLAVQRWLVAKTAPNGTFVKGLYARLGDLLLISARVLREQRQPS